MGVAVKVTDVPAQMGPGREDPAATLLDVLLFTPTPSPVALPVHPAMVAARFTVKGAVGLFIVNVAVPAPETVAAPAGAIDHA